MKLAPKEGYRCVGGVQELTVKHENHQMCKNLEDPNPCLSVGHIGPPGYLVTNLVMNLVTKLVIH